MDEGTKTGKNGQPQWLKTLGSPAILFYALPWLMLLLVVGTINQKDLGIFEAQKIYFSAWILWLGPIPLPGTYLTLGAITICLLAKFLLYSPWRAHQAGIILTHLGVLILLLGGIITACSQKEGFMLLREGQNGNAVSDYHARILTIEKDGEVFATLPFDTIKESEMLQGVTLPFTLHVDTTCRNCRPVPVKDTENRHGLAEQITLENIAPEKNNESNLSGLVFTVSGLKDDQNGVYLAIEEIPHKAEVNVDGATYHFSMGRAQTVLPFSITLKDFQRDLHPGTDMARGFSSDVVVEDQSIEWPYHIRMNEPLRYKGYTFYQASFSLRPDGEYSVLSVVRNKGRIFPYLSSVIIFAGLLLHVIIRLKAAKDKTA